MKKFLYLFFMFLVLSCDTVEEIYLYDSDDPEYSILQTMAVEACIDDAEIFDALDNFEKFASLNGPNFYNLPPNKEKLKLVSRTGAQILQQIRNCVYWFITLELI